MKKKKESGQAIVEIALMLPILAFLLCGIIDFGRILYAGITINMVAQESVRYSGLGKKNAEVIQLAMDNCSLSDKYSYLSVNIGPGDAPRTSGTYVTVNIDYEVNYITPLIKPIIGDSFTVSTSSTIRVE